MTQRVLKDCTGKYGVEINDLLLTTLSRAWKKVTGQNNISISMEGHGRESFGVNQLEPDRTVGWFTTIYPVLVNGSIEDIAEHVKQTAATIHAIPNKGFGYGLLRHIADMKELDCTPLITFNYLGSFEEGGNSDHIFVIDSELPKGDDISPLNLSGGVPLSINCATVKSCLVGTVRYNTDIISEEKAQSLTEEFSAQLTQL